jgi:adenosine deaminase
LLALGLLLAGCASVDGQTKKEEPRTVAGAADSCSQSNEAAVGYLRAIDDVKAKSPEMAGLLKAFPKGADLHNHVSGSIMPADYIALGRAQGDCFGPDLKAQSMYAINTPNASGACPKDFQLLKDATESQTDGLLRSLSMYRWNARGPRSVMAGHDQFFATFTRFEAVSSSPANIGPMLAKLLQQASEDGVMHVETMASFRGDDVNRLAGELLKEYASPTAFDAKDAYPAMYDFLVSKGLQDVVAAARADVASYVKAARQSLGCDTNARGPACEVSLRFQAGVNRNSALGDGSANLWKMFTQVALFAALANEEPTVVGVNLVSAEDRPVSMQSFRTQMAFFHFVSQKLPRVPVALHGGELIPCLVANDRAALQGHLVGSLEAGAKRLGHAVSFAYLGDAEKDAVAKLLREANALVEVPLTSNAQILGVAGDDHPFEQYFRKYGVAVAFATDDEGVSYLDYTSAWIYAAARYHLTYDELVKLARASLEHSFLSGDSLWSGEAPRTDRACESEPLGKADPGPSCRSFLAKNAKAQLQWRYEESLASFDKQARRGAAQAAVRGDLVDSKRGTGPR